MATSTLNPFKFSGRNLPTETEKYESSVYQTPELNPSLSDMPINGVQSHNVPKRLNYEMVEGRMSTIAKARPGGSRANNDSGSDENIPDSNESDYDQENDNLTLENAQNPF